jgi:polysaccharide biosynthesis protein EpsC
MDLEKILRRKESPLNTDFAMYSLKGKRVLITGAGGSIGISVANALGDEVKLLKTDIADSRYRYMDVRDAKRVFQMFESFQPEIVLHLAGAKHAGSGEEDVTETVKVNVNGSFNIINAANTFKSTVVLASTCKAVEPETVYGSTKLIAERYALNNNHCVARFFNVVETSGNVFEIWQQSQPPYKVASARRYFISLREATSLMINAAAIGYGRWAVNPGEAVNMKDLAADLLGEENINLIDRRRGDRYAEPLCGMHESIKQYSGPLLRIYNYHDHH